MLRNRSVGETKRVGNEESGQTNVVRNISAKWQVGRRVSDAQNESFKKHN